MNKQIKARWVKALRSGKYKQARGVLKNKEGAMCCLGVLTDLFVRSYNRTHKRKLKWKWKPSENGFGICGNAITLSDKVQVWAGVYSDNPQAGKCQLAKHNDGGKNYCATKITTIRPKQFPAIANLIEKHL